MVTAHNLILMVELDEIVNKLEVLVGNMLQQILVEVFLTVLSQQV